MSLIATNCKAELLPYKILSESVDTWFKRGYMDKIKRSKLHSSRLWLAFKNQHPDKYGAAGTRPGVRGRFVKVGPHFEKCGAGHHPSGPDRHEQ